MTKKQDENENNFREKDAVDKLEKYISSKLKIFNQERQPGERHFFVEKQYELPYYCPGCIKEEEYNKHKFKTDLFIYEEDQNKSSKKPRVVIEVKYKDFSSHDVITYSEKAEKHKILCPYLQYGFIVCCEAKDFLANKFFYHGDKFDFAAIVKWSNKGSPYNDDFLFEKIIKPAIYNSLRLEKLININNGQNKNNTIKWYRKDFVLPEKNEENIKDCNGR